MFWAIMIQLVDPWAAINPAIREKAMSKDLTQKLNGSIEDKIDRLIGAVESMDSRFVNALESITARIESLENRVERLEIKVDERMKETRPMWEALQAQLTELKESQEKGFRRYDRSMDTLAGDLNRLDGDNVDLESRVDKIEKRLNT